MAEIQLTIGDVVVATESIVSTVEYNSKTYEVSLININFHKKMYQPTEFHIKLELSLPVTSSKSTSSDSSEEKAWNNIPAKDIVNSFKYKKAKIEVVTVNRDENSESTSVTVNDCIGDDYYVHEVRPQYKKNSLYVDLTICSLDMLLTLNKECKTYVGKTLSDVINAVLPNYQAPYDSKPQLTCDVSGMQVLQIASTSDSSGKKEHKFPYLVQYNESFYDLLKRTTNRWGEFLYWENSKLYIGYDDSDSKVKDIGSYTDIYYFDTEDVKLKLPDAGSYDYAAAYDENVGNMPIKKDPYQLSGKIFRYNGKADVYYASVASRFFQKNEESLTSWMVGWLVDDLWDMLSETSYITLDNKDFNEQFFKGEDDQFNDDGSQLNLYTEYDSEFHKDTSYYSKILGKETAAGKNAIRISYGVNWPKLKLGDVINVYGDKFIVVEIIAKTPPKFVIVDNSEIHTIPGNKTTFEVVATAMDSDDQKFYPATLPTGHVRLSGPQVATIVDIDDPLKANRVRVVYDWQCDADGNSDEADYSPWLLYAAGSHSSPRVGRHLAGTNVLVGFANGNIERPYVLGNIQKADTFVELKDVSIETPGSRKFQMWDHPGGIQKMLAGSVLPALSTLSDFLPAVDYMSLGDGAIQYAGGFRITDKLGLYNISGSTDEREVKISSAWGDVKISAFTGITISAPNGDVRIKGKNVEIAAGNNLRLSSGTNVGYHWAWAKGQTASVSSILSDVCCKLIDKIGEKVQLIDLSIIRSAVEIVLRPQEGCMTLKSNRYMKIETGSNSCEYPAAAYNKDKRQKVVDEEAKSTILSSIGATSLKDSNGNTDIHHQVSISMLRGIVWIIQKLPGIASDWLKGYSEQYDELVIRKALFDEAIRSLKAYSNSQAWTTTDVCKMYDDLKEDIWKTDDTADWTEEKFEFTGDVKTDSNDVFADVTKYCRNRLRENFGIPKTDTKEQQKKLCEAIISKRKECRNLVVKRANELRKAIRELKPVEVSEVDLSKQFSDWVGYFRPYPDGFVKNLGDVLKKDNCDKVAVFHPNDTMKDLANKIANNGDVTRGWKKYMTRLVVVKFLQSLGFTDDMRREIVTDKNHPENKEKVDEPNFSDVSLNGAKSLANDGYWAKYVESLSGLPIIQKTESSLLTSVSDSAKDAVYGAVSVDDVKKLLENRSWSEGKKGGILFGYQGDTYELKGKQVEKIETIEPSFKSISENSGDIDAWEKERLIVFMKKLREELVKI